MIKKLASGRNRYEARGWANGRQFRRRFQTRKAADQYMRAIAVREECRRNGLPEEQGPITYRDLEAKFRLQHETQSRKWRAEMAGYSLERFGHVRVRDLRPDEIGAWLTGLNLSRQTKQHIRGAMRQVLERGVDWGYLARNPASTRLVKLPKQKPSDIRPFESWNEVEEIARATDGWDALVVFACATGLRPEEWIALTWDDLDLKQRTCRINKVVVDGELRSSSGKTDAAFRTIKLQQRAIDALQSTPRPIQSEKLVFPASQGGYVNLDNWRRRVWKEAFKKTEVPYRPLYQMRHTYATLALAAGADVYWVSRQLGHTSIQTTLGHYARFLPAVDERNLKILDEFAA